MVRPSEPTPETVLYATGVVKATGYVLDGAMHGAWEFFRKDGTLMRTGQFDRGTQVGSWRTYERSGRLVKETEFGAAPGERLP
jgi:antitoxin component YwqK of YwqJK toxin-antitoxin module